MDYGEYLVARMRRVDEAVLPLEAQASGGGVNRPDPGFRPTHKTGPTTPRTERVPLSH